MGELKSTITCKLTSRLSATRLAHDNDNLIPLNAPKQLALVLVDWQALTLRVEAEVGPLRGSRDERALGFGLAVERAT